MGQTDGQGYIDWAVGADQEYIYFVRSTHLFLPVTDFLFAQTHLYFLKVQGLIIK